MLSSRRNLSRRLWGAKRTIWRLTFQRRGGAESGRQPWKATTGMMRCTDFCRNYHRMAMHRKHKFADRPYSSCSAHGPPRRFAAGRNDDRSLTYCVGVHRPWHRRSVSVAVRTRAEHRSSLHLTPTGLCAPAQHWSGRWRWMQVASHPAPHNLSESALCLVHLSFAFETPFVLLGVQCQVQKWTDGRGWIACSVIVDIQNVLGHGRIGQLANSNMTSLRRRNGRVQGGL